MKKHNIKRANEIIKKIETNNMCIALTQQRPGSMKIMGRSANNSLPAEIAGGMGSITISDELKETIATLIISSAEKENITLETELETL